MLLTISTSRPPATDLGYLLHKHPDRCQTFELSFGQAHVFYPEASESCCTACLLLDVDPVGLVRGKGDWQGGSADQYVNDRPYVASSLMSVAISQVFGSALAGRSKDRTELVDTPLPLTAKFDVLPVRGDEQFPEWGESVYYSVTLAKLATVSELLRHLYVLIPVFDYRKHYYVGQDEVEKLLAKAHKWLAEHPERELITRRYLTRSPSLVRQALARLAEAEAPSIEDESIADAAVDGVVAARERSLHEQRIDAVVEVLKASGAKRVLDLGCGEGKLLRPLLAVKQFAEIVGMDVSIRSLEIAHRRLRLDRLPEQQRERIRLIHGSLTYRDERLQGFDAAAIVEVIEHLDPHRLTAFERVVFEQARPAVIVLTTPNREYNVMWESLAAGEMRHGDHRFEWTRAEFEEWGTRVAKAHGYNVSFQSVGAEDEKFGAPSQMAVFNNALK